MDDELKRCPFCGGNAALVSEEYESDVKVCMNPKFVVICLDCSGQTAGQRAKFSAINKWNTRA